VVLKRLREPLVVFLPFNPLGFKRDRLHSVPSGDSQGPCTRVIAYDYDDSSTLDETTFDGPEDGFEVRTPSRD
jgi:hypothetical protein